MQVDGRRRQTESARLLPLASDHRSRQEREIEEEREGGREGEGERATRSNSALSIAVGHLIRAI